ncbi:MAG: helix-turn-helix domain-containing protein [Sedimentisphaerales bacterium]|nr:helix-turn-helix domain-containing protein [Sedimentisphaerales bacterium]
MGVSYCSAIERMKWHGKLKNDSDVARVLGVTPQALSNYKKKGDMPSKLVMKFAHAYKISVDWLISGHVTLNTEKKFEAFIVESLTEQEVEYIGKLLKILRARSESPIIDVVKQTIDALYLFSERMSDDTENIMEENKVS